MAERFSPSGNIPEDDDARATVAEWVWTIIESVTIHCESHLSDSADTSARQSIRHRRSQQHVWSTLSTRGFHASSRERQRVLVGLPTGNTAALLRVSGTSVGIGSLAKPANFEPRRSVQR